MLRNFIWLSDSEFKNLFLDVFTTGPFVKFNKMFFFLRCKIFTRIPSAQRIQP